MRVLMSVTTWDAVRLQGDLDQIGFPVTPAEDGIAIFECLDLLGHPVVIMETDLPDLKWRVALDQLRKECPAMSILVINSSRSGEDQIDALQLGADDVLDPGVSATEVAARIVAVATRRAGYSGPFINLGPLQVSLSERKVWWEGNRVRLSPAQYTIFEALCLQSPHAVSKDDIMGELYGIEEGGEARTIDVFVANMRSRLMAVGAPWHLIETVRGRGYRLSDITPEDGSEAATFEMPVEQYGIPADYPITA